MSESEESDTWSGSVESYFSSDSSTVQCPRPRRLMDLIADKLRLMNCVSGENQQPVATTSQVALPDYDEEQSKNLQPHRLACLLRAKLEQLNAAREDEEYLCARSARRVTFPDLTTSFSYLTTSNQNVEQMEVDIHATSSSDAILLAPSANAAQANIQEENLVDMVLTEQENSILMLNFPEINVIVNDENGEVTLNDTHRFGKSVFEMPNTVEPQPSWEVERINQAYAGQPGVAPYFDVLIDENDENLD